MDQVDRFFNSQHVEKHHSDCATTVPAYTRRPESNPLYPLNPLLTAPPWQRGNECEADPLA